MCCIFAWRKIYNLLNNIHALSKEWNTTRQNVTGKKPVTEKVRGGVTVTTTNWLSDLLYKAIEFPYKDFFYLAMTTIYSILVLSSVGSMPEVFYRVNVVRHPQDEFLPAITYNIAAINGYSVSSFFFVTFFLKF